PGRDGLASAPWVDPHVLQAAARLRPCRGPPRAEVARTVQPRRASDLGRTGIRRRPRLAAPPVADLLRRPGSRALPAGPRATSDAARLSAEDARVVPRARGARRSHVARLRVETAPCCRSA